MTTRTLARRGIRSWFTAPVPLVAVARAVAPGSIQQGALTGESWQSEAWKVWHDLGEIHYPTSQMARLVSRVEWDSSPNTDLDDLFNPGVGELAQMIALNLYVAGSGWLILTEEDPQGKPTDPHWRVLPAVTSKAGQMLDRAAVKVRFWDPDPLEPDQANSAVRAALGPAWELITLQRLSRSQARNRLAQAGILLRPATRRPLVDDTGEPIDFSDMLRQAMESAISDDTSAAGVVPIDLELPAEEIEHWRHLTFERPFDENLDERVERAIRRIALALDIWPELLLGVADINHWGSWFLAEDTWRGHIAPKADQVAHTLEVAAAEVDVEIEITPNPAELLARKSTIADAFDGARLGAVGLAYLREVMGAGEDDAPTKEDLETLTILLGKRSPSGEEETGVEAAPGPPPGPPAEEEEQTPTPIAAAGGDITDGLGVALARVDDQLRSWLDGAAEQVVNLARSRVGMRVRSALRNDPRGRAVDSIPNSDVAARLGETAFDVIDADQTIRQTVEPLGERWVARLERAEARIADLVDVEMDSDQWALARKRSAEVLIDDLATFVADTLLRTDADLPALDLRRVVAAAGIE